MSDYDEGRSSRSGGSNDGEHDRGSFLWKSSRDDVNGSGSDCDPQSNVLMKRNGWRGIVVAVSVLVVCILIIVLSKWNEVRTHRVPLPWRNRLRTLVQQATAAVQSAREADTVSERERAAVRAGYLLQSAKLVGGPVDLGKLSLFDVGRLEEEIISLAGGKNLTDLFAVGSANTSSYGSSAGTKQGISNKGKKNGPSSLLQRQQQQGSSVATTRNKKTTSLRDVARRAAESVRANKGTN